MAKRDKTEDLVKELIHEEDWKRMNATAELLKRGPEAVRHLLTGLTDGNPRVRAEAALMLGRIKDRTAGVPIVKLLTDANRSSERRPWKPYSTWPTTRRWPGWSGCSKSRRIAIPPPRSWAG